MAIGHFNVSDSAGCYRRAIGALQRQAGQSPRRLGDRKRATPMFDEAHLLAIARVLC